MTSTIHVPFNQAGSDEMFLTPIEVRNLTGRVHRNQQISALDKMGIVYKPRPDGTLAVLRAHVEQLFGLGVSSRSPRKTVPNFSLVI